MKSPILIKAHTSTTRRLQFFAPHTYPAFLRKLHRLSEDYAEVRVWYEDLEGAKVLLIEETYETVLGLWPWLELKVEVERVNRSVGQWIHREALKMRIKGLMWMQTAKECWGKTGLYCRGKWGKGKEQAHLRFNSLRKRIATWTALSCGATCLYVQKGIERIQSQKRQFAGLITLLAAICVFSLTAQSLSIRTFQPQTRLSGLIHLHMSNSTENMCLLVPQCTAPQPLTYQQGTYLGNIFFGEGLTGFLLNPKQDTIKIGTFDAKYQLQGEGVLIGNSRVAIGHFTNDHLSQGRGVWTQKRRIQEGDFTEGVIRDGSEAVFSPGTIDLWRPLKWTTDMVSLYTGQWKHGVYEGFGELRTTDSSYYGEFVGGKATGKGLQRTGSTVSSGSFLNGELSGFGCMFKGSGEELCGQFVQGLCQGKAVRSSAGKPEVVSCSQGRESKDSWW